MAGQSGTLPSEVDFKFLGETCVLSPAGGVEFPLPGSSILSPLPSKVGVYLKTLETTLRLSLTNF